MATVHDVARYILERKGPMTAMKLQKLVYYAQAWSLVWDEAPLFEERLEAWANGPVCPTLYNTHRGQFRLSGWPLGNADVLTPTQTESVDAVLNFYGDKTSQWLSDLTHQERPWQQARKGLAPGDWSDAEITHASMAEYYGGLVETDE